MKKLLVISVLLCCAIAAGCSKDAEVASFLTEFESVTKQMTEKLNSGDIEGAQKVFDDNKSSLQSSFDSFKNAREMQISDDTKSKLESSVKENIKSLSSAATKAAISAGDQAKAKAIQSLLKDYVGIFQM